MESFSNIQEEVNEKVTDGDFLKEIETALLSFKAKIDESDYPLVNQPINHPAIKFVKNTSLTLFGSLAFDEKVTDAFIKDFNQNIDNTIIETFGEKDYKKHEDESKNKWIKENELKFLEYTKNLERLGLAEEEELQYQEAFGSWQDIRHFGDIDEQFDRHLDIDSNSDTLKEIEKNEKSLLPIEALIHQYFSFYGNGDDGLLDNILFLIADFGKGKTSFLQNLAAKLAKQYLKTNEGLFPVYLNLNEYDKYSNSPSLGVIANFLAKKFKIDIKDCIFRRN